MELLVNETWRDIPGYEGLYQVSSRGCVRSISRMIKTRDRWGNDRLSHLQERIISPNRNCKHGYLSICLYKDGTQKRVHIHRLVAIAFIPNPYGLPQINHKDEIRSNNNVENLEWCSAAYNNKYGSARQRMSATKSRAILAIDSSGNVVGEFTSSKEAGERYGVTRDAIFKNIKRGSRNKSTGLTFRYK